MTLDSRAYIMAVPQHLDTIFSVYVYVSGGFRLLHLCFLMLLFRMVWRLTSGTRRIHLRVYVALRSFDTNQLNFPLPVVDPTPSVRRVV